MRRSSGRVHVRVASTAPVPQSHGTRYGVEPYRRLCEASSPNCAQCVKSSGQVLPSKPPMSWLRKPKPDRPGERPPRGGSAIDLDVGRRAVERYDWTADDFTSPRGRSAWTMRFSRGAWDTRTETTTTLTCDADSFHVHATLDAYEGGERVFSRNWSERVGRDLR